MRKILKSFKDSSKELKSVKCITITAMFGAISIVLNSFTTVMVTKFLKIGFFSFLPSRLVYFLFGPLVGGLFGAAMDILNFIVKPTGTFHPGFTFNALISGIIYGIFLYKKPVSITRILAANIVQMIIVSFILGSYWLTHLTGMTFYNCFPRALKELIMLPFETFLFFLIIKGVEASGVLKLVYGK